MSNVGREDLKLDVVHLVSQPGDMTRYDFYVIQDYDDFLIAPCRSTFPLPQRLNLYDIKSMAIIFNKDFNGDQKYVGTKEFNDRVYDVFMLDINPHTLFQVAMAIYHGIIK